VPTPEASDAAPWIGRVIDGRYRIVELLGKGGMGAVYVAEHLTLRKQVAVKIIRTELTANSQAEARFAREALATAQIEHPHVVSAIDFGRLSEGGAYLVIQLVRGEGLATRLKRGALAWPEACELGAQVADALAAAHEVGIIHRDLKPDNILLERRRDGLMQAKVVDFGIAHLSGEHGGAVVDASQPITRMGAVVGTPGYMAPEQAMGGKVDARVDLYALGVILWECCAGQPLWEAETVTEMFTAQLTRAAPSLRSGVPEVPEALSGLLDRMLARTAAQRPPTALEVRDALRAIPRDKAVTPATNTRAAQAPDTGEASTPGATLADASRFATPADSGPARKSADTRRRGGVRPFIILAVIAALVAALLLATRDAAPPSPRDPATATTPTSTPAKPEKPAAGPAAGPLPARRELYAAIPKAYSEHAVALLTSTEPAEREAAAAAIVKAPESVDIPGYLREVAALERADECDDKREVLLRMERADDIRVLWALRILAASPRDACRSGRARRDCLGCLRDDLARVVARFEASAG